MSIAPAILAQALRNVIFERNSMCITSIIELDVVINSVKESHTLQDIVDCVAKNVNEWTNTQVIWDMNAFNFTNVNQSDIRSLILQSMPFSKKRRGMKTGIFVSPDLGFGMMRMLQMLSDEQLETSIGVFRTKAQALEWANEK